MKKLSIILLSMTVLAYVGCNMQEQKKEDHSLEAKIQEMTDTLAANNTVQPVADTAASVATQPEKK